MNKQLTDRITFRHGATTNNRIVQAPMLTNSGEDDGFVTQDTIDYYAARSRSAGIVIVEYCYVSFAGGPSRSWADDRQQLGIHTDGHMEGLAKIARALKKDGNKALVQLAHAGRESNFRARQGHTVYAPSAFDFGFLDYEVEALADEDIERIIQDFGTATRRAIDCGFDGVEIHGANHYLLQQFFSAWSNRRDDRWGGSADRRMRFIVEVMRKVFDVIAEHAPDDFIIGYRISPEEVHGDHVGYSCDDSLKLIQTLTATFDFDYIHVSLPQYDARPRGSDRSFGELFGAVLPEQTKLIVVGNVMSEESARDALGHADLVAVGRATLIDPEFGSKLSEGRGQDIVREISPEQVKKSRLTPGLVNLFSDPNMHPSLPGRESIYHLHEGGSLDKSVLKDGTGSEYNLDDLK